MHASTIPIGTGVAFAPNWSGDRGECDPGLGGECDPCFCVAGATVSEPRNVIFTCYVGKSLSSNSKTLEFSL